VRSRSAGALLQSSEATIESLDVVSDPLLQLPAVPATDVANDALAHRTQSQHLVLDLPGRDQAIRHVVESAFETADLCTNDCGIIGVHRRRSPVITVPHIEHQSCSGSMLLCLPETPTYQGRLAKDIRLPLQAGRLQPGCRSKRV
jgi:hypothetical protein